MTCLIKVAYCKNDGCLLSQLEYLVWCPLKTMKMQCNAYWVSCLIANALMFHQTDCWRFFKTFSVPVVCLLEMSQFQHWQKKVGRVFTPYFWREIGSWVKSVVFLTGQFLCGWFGGECVCVCVKRGGWITSGGVMTPFWQKKGAFVIFLGQLYHYYKVVTWYLGKLGFF